MKPEQMVHMANQIALFFKSYPQDEAVAAVADHLKKFWERRMMRQLFDYVDGGGTGLEGLVIEALALMRQHQPS